MTKLYEIIDECDRLRLFIKEEDIKRATVRDALENDWSLDDIYGSSLDEYLDENGELLESELDEDLGDYYCIDYWDGNNWRKDLIDSIEISEVEAEIVRLEDPSPAYYFNYEIKLENETVKCTKSNMSGSLSPYYKEYIPQKY